ncbi:MAG: radical SAM protein, partial [Deltaproteobacteria bacterium]|nr:radical SAM protein [Deltaproteobacteria bacterium]
MSQLGVYIHIPFCLSKCPYCNFNSSVVSSLPEDKYVEALLSDIRFTSKGHFSEYEMVDTIYFGGGTPSLFSPSSVGKVLDVIATCYSFSDDIEITLEANPGSLDKKKLKGFSDLGIKRLNLGFQSLKDHLLQK